MKQLQAVVFDLDGTLLNTLDDLATAVNEALRVHRMPTRTTDEVRRFVGNGVANLIRRAVPPDTTEEKTEQVLTTFKAYYAGHDMDTTAPYEGIPELLLALKEKGIAMAMVSNKLEEAVEALRRHFFADTIPVAVGDRPPRPVKPAPDSTLEALRQLGVSPKEALFVGDSEVDVLTARRVGMPCLSVSWGFRDAAVLIESGAEHIAASPAEALNWVLERV